MAVIKMLLILGIIFVPIYIILGILILCNNYKNKRYTKISTKNYVVALVYKRVTKKGKAKKRFFNVSDNNIFSLKAKIYFYIRENIKFIRKTGSLVPEKLYVYNSKINMDDKEDLDKENLEEELIRYIRDSNKLNKLFNKVQPLGDIEDVEN